MLALGAMTTADCSINTRLVAESMSAANGTCSSTASTMNSSTCSTDVAMPRMRLPSVRPAGGDDYSDEWVTNRLPAAAAEARTIADIYGTTPLIGDSAQSSKVLDGAANAGIIHIGAHTLINTDDPMQSSIVMSDSHLRVRDLASRRVRLGSIAVLAGCRTATRIGKSDINSLALAFLAAGSRSSVGSLWDVEDAATRRFSVRLHQLLRTGTPVSQAVRHAQLEMLRSSDPTLSAPRSWAAFQVYGGP